MPTRRELVDFFFDAFPEQFKGDREYWYAARGDEDKDIVAAFENAFTQMDDEARRMVVDFLFDAAPESFKGEREYWYTDRGAENADMVAAFGGAFTGADITDSEGRRPDDPDYRDPGTGRVVDPEEPKPREPGTPAGVLGGGILVQVRREGQEDSYIQMFEFPPGSGRYIAWQYDSFQQARDALGPAVRVEQIIEESRLSLDVNIVGSASEIVGVPGTFTGFIDDVIREAASRAGIADPSMLGRMISNPEIQEILALAALGEWTGEQMKAALRDTDFWTQELYPGIRNLYGVSSNPEEDYKRYLNNLTTALDQLGIPRELHKQKIAELLAAGVSDTEFLNFVPNYAKAAGNPQFKAALEERLRAAGVLGAGEFLDFNTLIDVLEGTAPVDIQNIVDEANLEFIAAIQNVDFDITGALGDISAAIDIDEKRATSIISSTSRALLALGDQGLRRGGFDTSDVLRASAGLGSGTLSNVALQQKIQKFAIEEGLMDDIKGQFFVAFDEAGRPQRRGLAATAPELG